MVSVTSRIAKIPNQLHTEIDGRIVVLNAAAGKYFEFDEIGSVIWARIDRYPLVADLCEPLVRDYRVDVQTVQADVSRLLGVLAANDLITVTAIDRGNA